ncbi:hypothetical protein [Streptomyces triticiradicis]|uniref:Uncharacterized protein n=1 Tax=Streptomyces triticiradicis TaxID=2651189 RepID=A0A7J5D523_9ACTN|nr:hypothetical protein [Streptomyces triticiradicis]KAB1979265.1 hypothetical protein F8144_36485 [Streptomyces triticiradicis]
MTVVDTARSVVSHRGLSCLELHRLIGTLQRRVDELTPLAEQATALEARFDGQARTIRSLHKQLVEAKQIRAEANAKAGRYDEAEARTEDLEQQLAEQTEELVALRAFKANVNSVSTLPRHQAPAGPPADRFETGTPVRLGASPLANADIQPIPLLARPEPAT